ncbi:MAG: hypothetical protein IPJ83_03070 [Saprospiraceae bacterium]|nr:hypothetical protein [Candidatus Vicinibacter proximus]MCC6841682.1 hypothetical protein [Saprospiraceae bacterium]
MLAEQKAGGYSTKYRFTGKEVDEETGLYYFGARYYDPRISLWFGVDPLTEKYFDYSPFTYTADNPIKYIDPDGRGYGDIYNLDGEHIGNDGIDDKKVYLKHTTDNKQMTREQSLAATNMAQKAPGVSNTTDVTSQTGLNNDELNLRSSLSTLKQAEAGSANSALDYNSWNNGSTFTNDSYDSNPSAYSEHPGKNGKFGSAAGAYQFLSQFYNESDFSPQSQDKAAVSNMTSKSYKSALSGDMSKFIGATKGRWISLNYWKAPALQNVFNKYRANELKGNSNIATPIGNLLRR